MNVVSLGRSIHYININQNILDRVRLVVSLNEYEPVVNVDRLGRSTKLLYLVCIILDKVSVVVPPKPSVMNVLREGRSINKYSIVNTFQ